MHLRFFAVLKIISAIFFLLCTGGTERLDCDLHKARLAAYYRLPAGNGSDLSEDGHTVRSAHDKAAGQ